MTPTIETLLENHGTRLINVEQRQVRSDERQDATDQRFDRYVLLMLGNLVVGMGGLVGIVIMLLKR